MSENKSLSIDLDGKQERALAMILQGEKDVVIAARLGIDRTTIYRWKRHDTDFMQALEDRQTTLREAAHQSMLELTESAVAAVMESLQDSDNRVRLQAARMVLDHLKVNKPDEKKEPSVIDLLMEALKGMEEELGIEPGEEEA